MIDRRSAIRGAGRVAAVTLGGGAADLQGAP
jgi:hypothetical protein